MNATIEWGNGFFFYDFEGDWNWDDFYRILERGVQMRGDQPTDVLLDFTKTTKLRFDAVLHLKPAVRIAETNSGRYVVITTTSSAQTMFNLFTRIYSQIAPRFFLVESMEAAVALLSKDRVSYEAFKPPEATATALA